MYDVEPEAEVEKKKASPGTCATRMEDRAKSWFATVAPADTPCLFGVDPMDEGAHCILDGGKFGSFGWCWTSEDKGAWVGKTRCSILDIAASR